MRSFSPNTTNETKMKINICSTQNFLQNTLLPFLPPSTWSGRGFHNRIKREVNPARHYSHSDLFE